MAHKLRAPLDVQWEITPWCCYNCKHCYNFWRRGNPPKRKLSPSEIGIQRTIVEQLLQAKVFHITLTGGEPLGVLEQIYPLLQILHEGGIYLTMNTNLALFDRRKAQLMRNLGIRSVLTSLISANAALNDKLAQQPGAFERTIRGIRLAQEEGFRVNVNMVVSKHNFHTIYETGKFVHELGAHAFAATKVSKPSNCPNFEGFLLTIEQVQQMLSELYRLKEDLGIWVDSLEPYPASLLNDSSMRKLFGKRQCSAGRASCTLGFDGRIRPCSHAAISYGTVSEGLGAVWERMELWQDGSLIPPRCQKCSLYPKQCNGGCRVESLNAGNGLNGSDPYCKSSFSEHPKYSDEVSLPVATLSMRFKLHSGVRFREESFGYIAYRDSAHWQAVESPLGLFLLKGLDFSAYDMARIYKIGPEEVLYTLQILLYKGLVDTL